MCLKKKCIFKKNSFLDFLTISLNLLEKKKQKTVEYNKSNLLSQTFGNSKYFGLNIYFTKYT